MRSTCAPRPFGASASVSERPPVTAIVFSFRLVKNPIRRLSGDQNGSSAPSVSSSRRAIAESSDRTHSCETDWLMLPTTNATIVPSGEIATPEESG